jgi:hypothetical protein
MVKVLSEEEFAVLVRNSERYQHLQADPRILDAFGVSTLFALQRIVDAEIKAVKLARYREDTQDE